MQSARIFGLLVIAASVACNAILGISEIAGDSPDAASADASQASDAVSEGATGGDAGTDASLGSDADAHIDDGASNLDVASSPDGACTPGSPDASNAFGSANVSSMTDYPGLDMAQAFRFSAARDACASTVSVYVADLSAPVLVGIYGDAAGVPGTLLATATIPNPKLMWNSSTLSQPVSVKQGDVLWIAVGSTQKGDAGVVWFRDENAQSGASFAASLVPGDGGWAMPSTWVKSIPASEDKLSAYVR